MICYLDNIGVSPVIGIILMVALTVSLVALSAVIVFDIGGDISEPADITVDLETSFEEDELIQSTVEVIRNENVDGLTITYMNVPEDLESEFEDSDETIDISPGETAIETSVVEFSQGDTEGEVTVVVVAEVDGSSEVVTTEDIQFTYSN